MERNTKNALTGQLSDTFRIEENIFAGRLMSIHVNIEHISSVIARTSKNGKSFLFPFLETLMGDIQSALGDINNFLVTYDEDNGLNIKDDTVIPGALPPPFTTQSNPEPTLLRLNGLLPNEQGSFVRKVSAASKITGALATQIMIGSTASGGSGQINNSTALLSRWNSGLVDRIQKTENEEARENNPTTTDDSADLLDSINKKYLKQIEWIKETYVDFKNLGVDSNSTAQSNLTTLLEYDLAVKTINGEIPGIGFIPLDLSIEMDGMSGIKLFQKIPTTQEVLPISYIDKVDFIVMALDHTIQNNEWVTLISTLSVPKKEVKAIKTDGAVKDGEFSLLKPLTEE